jgi:isopenicillin-N epimerase
MKSADLPVPSEFAGLWALDADAVYLNHGSFGAIPEFILQKQQEYRRMLESHPVRFLIRQAEELYDASRRKAAAFVNSRAEDLVFVQNATTAVNTVFRSLKFEPGDEILITNHIYPACRRLLEFISEQTGAVLIEAWYGFPIESPDVITEAILREVTPRTRIALIDHITSATALIHPVDQIVKELENRGVDVMIDGAHALGSIPVDVQQTGAAYYTANCHKWLCAPKSTAILHVRQDKQKGMVPLVISHAGHRAEPFTERFYWPGTYDPSAAICVGDAIGYMESLLAGGWPALMKRNHNLCIGARNLICGEFGIEKPCPDEMVASMATLPLPTPDVIPQFDYKSTDPFQEMLFREFNIEAPFWFWSQPPRRLTRISAQLYNSIAQYRYFTEVLKRVL